MRSLIILGAGGHGRVVMEAAIAAGIPVAGFLADGEGSSPVRPVQVLGGREFLAGPLARDHDYIVAIGHQSARRAFSEEIAALGLTLATVIHPAAWISPSATIGAGTAVVAGVVVNADAKIGRFCILNTGCSVDHDCLLEDGVQVCPGARLAGGVVLEDEVFIGTGATLIPRVRVGRAATVGAGAVVIGDVPAGETWVGNPAKAKAD